MTRTQRLVLTGAPGSGKSSIITALEIRGETTMREVAADYIGLQQALGNNEPWKEEDFQEQILGLQLHREFRLNATHRAFLDRGVHDGLAYPGPERVRNKIRAAAATTTYQGIYLVAPLEHYENNTYRREDANDAMRMHEEFRRIYTEFGYEPIVIPPLSLNERVEMILEHANQ